jgi:flavin reductase (DIM6/NTAB) family NADH-FMN oxidoreductase RutF/rubredoxin
MINTDALFDISYGLYIVCSGDKNKGNGFISNTVFQVTSKPAKFAVCCNKNNYTADFIKNYGAFSVSVLGKNASSETIGHFGYKSGRDIDKLGGYMVKYGETGSPIVLNDSIAYLECKVCETIDVGTHLMFIGELISSVITDENDEPITYLYYRNVRKGVSPKNAPTYIDPDLVTNVNVKTSKAFKCMVCGYIYDEADEDVKFGDLPDDWICPVCSSPKSDFKEI